MNFLQNLDKQVGRFYLLLAFLLGAFLSNAQTVSYTIVQSSDQDIVIRVDFPDYSTQTVQACGQSMVKLSMPDAYPVIEAGMPELLKIATSVIIPENSFPTAEVLNVNYRTIGQVDVAPSKGKLYRNINPENVPYSKGSGYAQDRFFYQDTVVLGEAYQLRDYTGMSVQFFPFAYNPVRRELKVYESITVRIRYNSTSLVQHPQKVSKTFNTIYKEHFLNYRNTRSTPLEEDGDILILAPENFCDAMQPYVKWKTMNGYRVELVSLSTIGNNSTAVKNFITNYYNNHNLTFLLLVGDSGQFPVIRQGGNTSDNYYAEVAGNDNYPDIIVGKISAETVAQVNTQVERFIAYEQNPPETSHFPVFCGIASSQGPGDNNEYDYTHIRNIDNILQNYTYIPGYEFFEGSRGGLDAAGNPTASMVANALNTGVGIINYCGHGDDTFWVTSNFSVNHIGNLTNYNKLPFIISVACVNGNYVGQTCFAEAWLRATNNGNPTGAVSVLMSTINQPWNSPMCAQDRMNLLLTGSGGVTQKHTFGGIVFNGILHMLDTYNDYEVARTWILFGDPTLMVRTAEPQQLNLSYSPIISPSISSVSCSSPVEDAKVTLTLRNQILSSGQISNGTLTIPLSTPLVPYDTIMVVASHPNYIPFVGTMVVMENADPYIVINGYTIQDNGNQNGLADYGETVDLSMILKNIGSKSTGPVQTSITTDCPYITITKRTMSFSELDTNETQTFSNAYKFVVDEQVPAYENAQFNMMMIYDEDTVNVPFSVMLHAPQVTIGSLLVDDAAGNRNGRLDFGERATLIIDVQNVGNSVSKEGTTYFSSPDGKLIFYRYPQIVPELEADSSYMTKSYIGVKSSITEPTVAILHVLYVTDNYSVSKDFEVFIGIKEENWETGDFLSYDWVNGVFPWTITTQNPYEGNYAVRSGVIGNNGSSELSLTVENSSPDTLSFYLRVSSEKNYDYLNFYIDGIRVERWTGDVDWTRAAYYIESGTHTFKWQYKKDNYYSEGEDLAMIDLIRIPRLMHGVGIETIEEQDFRVYPNPTQGTLKVLTGNWKQPRFQLTDLSGRLLQQGRLSAEGTLSLASYANGIYFLTVFSEEGNFQTIKIVKQ